MRTWQRICKRCDNLFYTEHRHSKFCSKCVKKKAGGWVEHWQKIMKDSEEGESDDSKTDADQHIQ